MHLIYIVGQSQAAAESTDEVAKRGAAPAQPRCATTQESMACKCKDTECIVLFGRTRTTGPRSALCTRSVGDEQQVLSVQHKLTKEVIARHATGKRRVRTSPLWVK